MHLARGGWGFFVAAADPFLAVHGLVPHNGGVCERQSAQGVVGEGGVTGMMPYSQAGTLREHLFADLGQLWNGMQYILYSREIKSA